MKAKPIEFNWISTNKDQEVTRCSLPWEVSLYRSLQQKLDKPCLTLDQYKAKVVGMEAYIYQFLNPISSEYVSCPGTMNIFLFSTVLMRQRIWSPFVYFTITVPCSQSKIQKFSMYHMPQENSHQAFVKDNFNTLFGMEHGSSENATKVLFKYSHGAVLKENTKSYLVDPVALVSNIGGSLGLALGISVFSALDYITIKLIKRILNYGKK